MSVEEIKRDLEYTVLDKQRLQLIVDNLRLFIVESGGEDRSFLRAKLIVFESMLGQSQRLEAIIGKKLAEATS